MDSLHGPVRLLLTDPSECKTIQTGHLHRVWARRRLLSQRHNAVHGVEHLAGHLLIRVNGLGFDWPVRVTWEAPSVPVGLEELPFDPLILHLLPKG